MLFCVSAPKTSVMKVSSNSTLEASLQTPAFARKTEYIVMLSLIDIIPFLVGLPLMVRLTWVTLKSMKTIDILHFNLALINFFHYWIAIVHLHILLLQKNFQYRILIFLCLYSEIGGPVSVFFISLERYIAVVFPMYFQLLKAYRFREVSALIVWCFTVSLSSIYIANSNNMEFYTRRVFEFPPILLLAISIMTMHCSIKMAHLLMQPGPGRRKAHPVKRKAFKTVCTNIVIIMTFYTPVTLLQRIPFSEGTYLFKVLPLCVFLLSVASIVHSLLYLSGLGKLNICSKGDANAK